MLTPEPLRVLSNKLKALWEGVWFILKAHTMSFKDTNDGFTHVVLDLGRSNGEAALKYDPLKCHHQSPNKWQDQMAPGVTWSRSKFQFSATVIKAFQREESNTHGFLGSERKSEKQLLVPVHATEVHGGWENSALAYFIALFCFWW